jgi:hypothetical protein
MTTEEIAPPVEHNLYVAAGDNSGTCACGESFSLNPKGIGEWKLHVFEPMMLAEIADTVSLERAARSKGEMLMARAVKKGVSTHKIAEACGKGEDEKFLISPTTIQRIARTYNEPESKTSNIQTPRRRRRGNG